MLSLASILRYPYSPYFRKVQKVLENKFFACTRACLLCVFVSVCVCACVCMYVCVNRTVHSKWVWSLKDKLSIAFNPVNEKKILSKESDPRKSANEMKKFTTRFLCDITSKDPTKFGSKIQEVDTSHFKLFFFFNFCTSYRTIVMSLQRHFLWKKQVIPRFLRRV